MLLLIAWLQGSGAGGMIPLEDFVQHSLRQVETVVHDQDRRKQARDILKTMRRLNREQKITFGRLSRELARSYDRGEASDEAVEAVWAKHAAATGQIQQRYIDLRMQLRLQLTESEWRVLYADPPF
jgi:signal transduction protein with GAF and PtsI domain